jgi:hypothetical protein
MNMQPSSSRTVLNPFEEQHRKTRLSKNSKKTLSSQKGFSLKYFLSFSCSFESRKRRNAQVIKDDEHKVKKNKLQNENTENKNVKRGRK